VLVGEPGVGKTAIAEGLAQRIVKNDVPVNLQGVRLIALDMGALVAGAKFRCVGEMLFLLFVAVCIQPACCLPQFLTPAVCLRPP
jgi:ABC-type antimicrobial peptide transport system ATPase subunit